jgi:hypothetical protein
MPEVTQFHKGAIIYGGPMDGKKGVLIPLECEAADLNGTRYVLSGPWSEHFGKPTFIPAGFPGRPAHFAA